MMNKNLPSSNEIHRLFHTLWTKAVGSETYNKKEWNQLDTVIAAVVRALR